MYPLQNKIIFLTGAADGIGWECAKAYAGAGASVCIADVNPEGADKLQELKTGDHLFITCDLTREQEVQQAMEAVIQKYGALNALHNNAGTAHPSKPLHTTTGAEWELLMNVNLRSIFYTTRYGIGHLKASKGCVLHTSSLVGSIGQENHAAYTATKGAINALTKSMALDYAPWGVRVNAVAPAAIKTPMLEAWSREQPYADRVQEYLDRLQPLGKMPGADVIADACIFLMSDAARFITGCILPVTGGAELGYRILLS
ncbi:SDR family NAD(P)-dependent oxidoreductase [Niabella aurantiaca]|uniref:SDR family NAD(P)-dependent oxidoreductase n=1 Tax=Niabella aurantiaca TaxID=379900 RepID=UPI00037A437E|nr:SDR family oxidoreductase [Niabella aurantiaca]